MAFRQGSAGFCKGFARVLRGFRGCTQQFRAGFSEDGLAWQSQVISSRSRAGLFWISSRAGRERWAQAVLRNREFRFQNIAKGASFGLFVESPRMHLRRSACLIHNRIGNADYEVTKTSLANKLDTYRDVTVAEKVEVAVRGCWCAAFQGGKNPGEKLRQLPVTTVSNLCWRLQRSAHVLRTF